MPDKPLELIEAINRVGRDLIAGVAASSADFDERLDRFKATVASLIEIAGFYVGDGDQQYLAPDPHLGQVARAAFIETDKARWELRPPWQGGLSGRPPAGSEFVHAAITMFDQAARTTSTRWGCVPQWFVRDGERPWQGRLYPDDFPWRYTVTRRELEMYQAAMKLFSLAPPASTLESQAIRKPDLDNATKEDVWRFLYPDPKKKGRPKRGNWTHVMAEAERDGRISLEEFKPPTGKRTRWRVWRPGVDGVRHFGEFGQRMDKLDKRDPMP